MAGDACAHLLGRVLNPGGAACPACGQIVKHEGHFHLGRRIRCTACGRRFTAFSGTVLEGCKLSLEQVTLVCLLLALGQDNATVAELAGISAETARSWRAKLGAA